ncbi:MAG: ligand-binding sensor domain-containing protein, partial [Saprospiraceae bacterium]
MNQPITYKTLHWSLTILLVLVFTGTSISQLDDLHFENLTVEDGLSHGTVQSIYQDHKGYMWFGTEYGLNQYDGYQFNVFQNNPEDSNSIDYNEITFITEDSQDRLWVGTKGSLNYFNRNLSTFIHYQHDPNDANSIAKGAVNAILEDHEGILWVSTPGMLHEFNPVTGVFKRFLAKDHEGNLMGKTGPLYEDSHHNLWVATEKGVRLFDRTKREFSNPLNDNQEYVDEQVAFHMTLIEDQRGDLWVASRGDGLRRFSYSEQTWQHYRHEENNAQSLRSNFVNGLLEDQDGRIWISTGRSGLDYIDIETEVFFHVQSNTTVENSLRTTALNTLFEDKSGGIWIGTWFAGLSYLQKDSQKFQHFKKDESDNSLSSNLVQAVVSDKDGNLWIGTEEGGGLNYYSPKERLFKTIVAPQMVGNKHLGSLNIKSLLCSRTGQIWIGTMEGLDMYDPTTFKWTYYRNDRNDIKSIMPGFVNSLLEDAQGHIWAGISGGGLNRLVPESGTFTYFPYGSEVEGRHETILALIE